MVNEVSSGIARLMLTIEKELVEISKKTDPQIEKLIEIFISIHKKLFLSKGFITDMPTIFFGGAGISQRRALDFGTRFGQLGFRVGNLDDGRVTNIDTVIYFSSSATTLKTVSNFNMVKEKAPGATIIVFTSNPNEEMPKRADLTIWLPGRTDVQDEKSPLALLGANFESACDKLVSVLVHKIREKIAESEKLPVEKSSVSEIAMRKRHALI